MVQIWRIIVGFPYIVKEHFLMMSQWRPICNLQGVSDHESYGIKVFCKYILSIFHTGQPNFMMIMPTLLLSPTSQKSQKKIFQLAIEKQRIFFHVKVKKRGRNLYISSIHSGKLKKKNEKKRKRLLVLCCPPHC